VMDDNEGKPEFFQNLRGNSFQLMFCHFPMRFVFDSIDFEPILGATNNSPKFNRCACAWIDVNRWRSKLCFGH